MSVEMVKIVSNIASFLQNLQSIISLCPGTFFAYLVEIRFTGTLDVSHAVVS